jgi:hypothetical protein
MKREYVVDTNVGVVANDGDPSRPPRCVIACVEALQLVQHSRRLAIDDGNRILAEYCNNLKRSGRPGVGDAFLKWVWDNRFNSSYCEQVAIHARPNSRGEDFDEFPRDEDLRGFDHADRKFVAVAIASQSRPSVMNATDGDWFDYHQPLVRHGVKVEQLCPEVPRRSQKSRPNANPRK